MSKDSSPMLKFSKSLSFSRKRNHHASRRFRVHSIDDIGDFEDFQVVEVDQKFNRRRHREGDNGANDNYDIQIEENIALTPSEKISREREIFLRAALQLLEGDQENQDKSSLPSDTQQNNPTQRNGKQKPHRLSHRSNGKTSTPEVSSDVIRYGILRKASRGGTFTALSPHWKTKYVELKYGKLTYEDENNHNWKGESSTKKKTIDLAIDACRCRAFKIKSIHGSSVFELTNFEGQRRLWMAGSERERDLWVHAINNAMIGGIDEQLGISHELGRKVFLLDGTMKNEQSNSFDFEPLSSTKHQNDSTDIDSSLNGHKKSLSFDGPAAAFAEEIAKFVSIRSVIHAATDSTIYHNVLGKLCNANVNIRIPVYYVRSFVSDQNFALSAQDTFSRQTLQAVEKSQIWKDLQRDAIAINGELVRGESGTEAMVGALMRHIMDRVETIRSNDEASLANSRTTYQNNQKQKIYSRFDITEAQALACARDLLMLCNRTQSGGDSYFCVDALLCDKDKGLCIITPLAAEADPIMINVDIVKGVDPSDDSVKSGSHPFQFRSRVAAPIDGLEPDNLLNETSMDRKEMDEVDSDSSEEHRRKSLSAELSNGSSEALEMIDIPTPLDSPTPSPPERYKSKNHTVNHTPNKQRVHDIPHRDISHSEPPPMTRLIEVSVAKASLSEDFAMTSHEIPPADHIKRDLHDRGLIPVSHSVDGSNPQMLYISPNASSDCVSECSRATRNEGRAGGVYDDASVISDITNDTAWRTKPSQLPRSASEDILAASIELIDRKAPESIEENDASPEEPVVEKSSSKGARPRFSIKTKKALMSLAKSLTPSVRRDSLSHDGDAPLDSFGDPQTMRSSLLSSPSIPFFRNRGASMSAAYDHGLGHPSAGPLDGGSTQSSKPLSDAILTPLSRAISVSGNHFTNAANGIINHLTAPHPLSSSASGSSNYCVRIEVRVNSRYRVCDSNPQDDVDSTWGELTGQFQQTFFIRSGCRGRPVISDRVVKITVDKASNRSHGITNYYHNHHHDSFS